MTGPFLLMWRTLGADVERHVAEYVADDSASLMMWLVTCLVRLAPTKNGDGDGCSEIVSPRCTRLNDQIYFSITFQFCDFWTELVVHATPSNGPCGYCGPPLSTGLVNYQNHIVVSNGGKDTTPSGTELLLSREGKARDDEDEIENSMASCVTSEDSKGSTAKRAEAGDPQREGSAKEKNKEGGKEEKAAKGNAEAGSQNDAKEEDESHGNKEDDEGLQGDESSIMFPGSPSFRINFTDNLDEDDDNVNGGKKDIGENEKTIRDHGTPPERDLQDSDPKKLKKGRKRSSFRKVMPKGGQNAMNNLFNVRSCYSPSCSSHDRAHLLTEKTPA
ncbi:uncharacterized protein LOC131298758 [Rhododendron vialii]|uniref:uncharacterized protein LOC131298758 n=1 Tax=Rhododendron vialii TaxID=182163 RepID=UPI00265FCBFD|nr:uncharacterized protein LOC131298758 [Rhododendron vialii]